MPLIHLDMRMSEAVESYPSLIPVINRFGIRLGLGEDTTREICDRHGVDADFFITIVNTFLNEHYFPEKKLQGFHLTRIVDYLTLTDVYYQHVQLPNIERHLSLFISAAGRGNESLTLAGKLFSIFKDRLLKRIETDRDEWFPHILELCGKQADNRPLPCRPAAGGEEDDPVEALLKDLKNIMIRRLTGEFDENLCCAVILAINMLHVDMKQHNRIRYRILAPIAAGMEQEDNCRLSARETEVLREIVRGRTNKEIGEKLFISLNTVLTHRKNITCKLGIKTVPGLTYYAITNSILPGDEIEIGL